MALEQSGLWKLGGLLVLLTAPLSPSEASVQGFHTQIPGTGLPPGAPAVGVAAPTARPDVGPFTGSGFRGTVTIVL